MSEHKMGRKDGPRQAAKKFERVYRHPLSKRIVDFLREESSKEKEPTKKKKIAQTPGHQNDLDV